jgi:shikimate dehydrogenase
MGLPYAEVIGDPIAHSRSPLIHTYWLAELGLDGDYRATRVRDGELPAYLDSRRDDPDWRGCNVTMPLKQAVLPLLDRLSPVAQNCGAANAVFRVEDGALVGDNKDAPAIAALLRGFGRRPYPGHVATYVQIIGAGGAARAAITGAVAAGYVDFDFFNRTIEGARALAVLLDLNPDTYSAPLEAIGPIRNPDDGPGDQRYSHIVINASSMGMEGQPDVTIDLAAYYPDTMVIDLAYGRGETGLARQARALGLRVADGLDMLVAQAALAFEGFFGVAPPRAGDAELRGRLEA